MDGARFDALARMLGSLTDRRTAARTFAAGARAGPDLTPDYEQNVCDNRP